MSKLNHLKANRKKIAPVVLLLIIISGAIYYFSGRDVSFTGIAEAVIITNPAEISGKIVESRISIGQEVKAGDVIAVIDSKELLYALEQLELNLEKAVIQHSDALAGQGNRAQNSIAAAQAAVNGAAATANQAFLDYLKSQELYQANAISENALEAAKLKADTAASALAAARAQLDIARNNSAGSATDSSNIEVLLLESKISQQKDAIKKCTVRANADGTVISRNYGAGDFVAPGHDIADIASATERYLVVYYPKNKLSDISYDQNVSFLYGNSEYTGPVRFIDVKPQYTPQDFQTAANKNKESVKVKILIPENCPIKPGEAAKILRFAA